MCFFYDVGGVLDVVIKEVEANKRVVFDWPASGVTAQVEIVLEATDRNTTTTKVTITESGWPMDSEGVGRVQLILADPHRFASEPEEQG